MAALFGSGIMVVAVKQVETLAWVRSMLKISARVKASRMAAGCLDYKVRDAVQSISTIIKVLLTSSEHSESSWFCLVLARDCLHSLPHVLWIVVARKVIFYFQAEVIFSRLDASLQLVPGCSQCHLVTSITRLYMAFSVTP